MLIEDEAVILAIQGIFKFKFFEFCAVQDKAMISPEFTIYDDALNDVITGSGVMSDETVRVRREGWVPS